jgi:lipopolysaccharide export LptBFGC system permease protein LptF
MGVSRRKRLFHFIPLFLILPLFCFYFEGFLIPEIRNTLKNPQNLITQNLISKLDKGFQINAGGWLLGSHQKGNFLIARDHPESSTILLCNDLEVDSNKNFIAKQGYLWADSEKENEIIQFETTHLPLNQNLAYSAKELNFFELNLSHKDQRHQAGLILRNTFAPIFLIYLGLALGYYGMTITRGISFLIALGSLLLMYLPLHILGRSVKTDIFILNIIILILPYLGCLFVGMLLNAKAERHGAC